MGSRHFSFAISVNILSLQFSEEVEGEVLLLGSIGGGAVVGLFVAEVEHQLAGIGRVLRVEPVVATTACALDERLGRFAVA